jgi:hypothetical protein
MTILEIGISFPTNGSSEEMQSSTSSIKQVPEFERCRYNKNGEVIVNLQSVFDGAFANVKMKTIRASTVVEYKFCPYG